MKTNKVIVALDSNNIRKTISLVSILKNEVFAFKLGYEFFYNYGVEGYKAIYKISPKIFLDLKLHDIPNTVQNGMIAINKMKPLLTTIHISGGEDMMSASFIKRKFTKILGVTVLTSFNERGIKEVGLSNSVQDQVLNLARLAKENNLDGIVCSPHEIKKIKLEIEDNLKLIVPGIRSIDDDTNDQKRTMNASEAMNAGADILVIGRPITMAKDPAEAAYKIFKSL